MTAFCERTCEANAFCYLCQSC